MNILLISLIQIILFKNIHLITIKLKKSQNQNQKYRNLKSLSPIYGNTNKLHYYYTNLFITKNKINQSYILDTGSSITTSPCSLCTKCGNHLNNPYPINKENILECNSEKCNMVKSNCLKDDNCSFNIFYNEGSSLYGLFTNEEIYFSDNLNEKNIYTIPIGCTINESDIFENQLVDGILGLDNSEKNFVSVLKKNNVIQKNIFTLCFTEEGGYFSIGEINNQLHNSNNISYTKFKEGDHYFVKVSNIQIDDQIIEINKNTFIDSGTTLTFIPKKFSEKIITKIIEICNKEDNLKDKKCGIYVKISEYGHCFTFNNYTEIVNAINNTFPNIIFNINNELNYFWEPKNYFINISEYKNTICIGIKNRGNTFILGSTWMKGYDIIFDRENFLLGFVSADCNKKLGNEKYFFLFFFFFFFFRFLE